MLLIQQLKYVFFPLFPQMKLPDYQQVLHRVKIKNVQVHWKRNKEHSRKLGRSATCWTKPVKLLKSWQVSHINSLCATVWAWCHLLPWPWWPSRPSWWGAIPQSVHSEAESAWWRVSVLHVAFLAWVFQKSWSTHKSSISYL